MVDINKDDIREWKDHPTTKHIIVGIVDYANDRLSQAPPSRHQRDQICDEVQGIRMVLDFINNYEGET